jgi:sugar O-acyltransferase (sialic acid O-acetyltransferase NeuD family)
MATEVILPKLGMNMESAKIVRWLKGEGDTVSTGDVLAEVETDKTTTELEAEAAGVLRKVLAGEGEQVAVSQVLAIIGTADEDITALSEQKTAVHPAGHVHVHHVYEAWRHQPDLPADPGTHGWNGNGNAAGVASSATIGYQGVGNTLSRPDITHAGAGASPDPDAIRRRLGLASPKSREAVPVLRQSAVRRIAIYGAGLGAKQLLEVTRLLTDVVVVGLIDDNAELAGKTLAGIAVLGGTPALADLVQRGQLDGVALSFHSEVRRRVHRKLKQELGVQLMSLVDPRAIVGMGVKIEEGALIEAGAVIGPDTIVCEGAIVDVGAVVAHDCHLGPFSHLSPGCTLSGVVDLTENVLVGVGACINSTATVGRNVIIAPGAAVMNDVPDDVVVSGVPAKVIGQSRRGA